MGGTALVGERRVEIRQRGSDRWGSPVYRTRPRLTSDHATLMRAALPEIAVADAKVVAKQRTPKEIKRNRQSLAANERNRSNRTRLRSAVKALTATIDAGDAVASDAQLSATVSALHKMAGKGIIHKRNAARQASRLTKHVNKLQKK